MLQRVEPTWWGAVVTDSRFPAIHDLNYARVDSAQLDLSLSEVEEVLLPAVRASGAAHFHVVMFEPDGCANLLGHLEAGGHPLSWDTVMRFDRPPSRRGDGHAVQLIAPGPALWSHLDRGFLEFGLSDPEVRRQMLDWNRRVLAPAGRTWFGAVVGDDLAGIGSMHVLDGVGYVDDVLTMPDFRRRGIASAVVRRLVVEAVDRGAEHVVLLTDRSGPVRLYRSLGFEEAGKVASALSRLDEPGQPSGSSGSAVGSAEPADNLRGEASDQGAGAG